MQVSGTSYVGFHPSMGYPCDTQIFIVLQGGKITVMVNLKDTVEELKQKICLQQLSPQEKIALSYEGEALEDDRMLISYEIKAGSTLCEIIDGQKETNKICFSFNALVDPEFMNFAKTGPDYLTVDRGLNLRGKCKNSACEANNKVVWIQKKMGTFDIGMEVYTSECPSCHKVAEEVDNLGFWDCQYSIEGFQLRPEKKKVDEKNLIAGKEKFTTFKQSGTLADWSFLKITTAPIKK